MRVKVQDAKMAGLPFVFSYLRFKVNFLFTSDVSKMAETLASEAHVAEWADRLIKQHKVVVFSKSNCPYCRKAIEAFQSVKAKDMHVEEIEGSPYMDAIQDYMKQQTGARSVPRVFIGGQFLGGADDTIRAKADGTLVEKLRAAGAL
ncbi:putative glutaredoxin [Toxoplasma gondii TgCatPRC2]|uniref:Glutaredoxin n=11 Tax=Toxoplasma gondii TaxID=5811 RepID=A0A125YYW6_TOXGV|nr:putative glutaredoxin [Toxoplasma gondii GT1]ESS33457.1 putative glutaredoxin [Toxoplasma gondii VEG]KAF4644015.1 putative glutaredoxin [Toxoplasma gondii]KFG38992.1 putative glutaredoxin [Toxoplasma gondii GAB2-2007-GAL-DOM2]KFG42560.1 putative glutaredoxin [Toxoplasma gondii FOU]KFG58990.1 putative glutaredoxin [Toxoplasma gondii RUB]KFH01580.1 putative glutaredoxin [Toxoplasma gondii VAND]KFH13586.1 putative glutaredoxin [Toxoplasma gondii MAS]KYK64836.1 putative glutaredoxin [Toxopla